MSSNTNYFSKKPIAWAVASIGVATLAACGGGGGSPAPAPAPAPATTFSTSGVKGPISGATVTATDANGNSFSCGTSGDDGSASCSPPAGSPGPYTVVYTGGQFCANEGAVSGGCGGAAPVNNPGNLRTVLQTGQTTATATPFTEAAFNLAAATPGASFADAYQTVAANFGLDADPTVSPLTSPRGISLATRIAQTIQQNPTVAAVILSNISAGNDPTTGQPYNPTVAGDGAADPDAPTTTSAAAPPAAAPVAPTPTAAPTPAPTPTAAPTPAPTPTAAPTPAPTPAAGGGGGGGSLAGQPCTTGATGSTGTVSGTTDATGNCVPNSP